MELSSALPTLGTIALAAGLLMPFRDGRHGRRATLREGPPVRAIFTFDPQATAAGDRLIGPDPVATHAVATHAVATDVVSNDVLPTEPARPDARPAQGSNSANAPAPSDLPAGSIAAVPAAEASVSDRSATSLQRREMPEREARPLDAAPSAVAVRYPRAVAVATPSERDRAALASAGRTTTLAEDCERSGVEPQPLPPECADEVRRPRRLRRPLETIRRFLRHAVSWTDVEADTAAESPRSRSLEDDGGTRAAASPAIAIPIERGDDAPAFQSVLKEVRESFSLRPSPPSDEAPRLIAPPDGPVLVADAALPSPPTFEGEAQPVAPIGVSAIVTADRVETEPPLGRPATRDDDRPAVEHAVTGRPRPNRAVPVTRLPLRPVVDTICWTERLVPPESDCSRDRRLVILRACADGPERRATAALIGAWFEERGELRTIALRALVKCEETAETVSAFRDAIRNGTDDERAIAIDGLAASGLTREMEIALGDRVDAIVARALLALEPSRCREEHVRRLDRHLEPIRRDAILELLAGVYE